MPVGANFTLPSPSPVMVRADLLELGPVIRHDPDKLGPVLCDLATRRPKTGCTMPMAARVRMP